MKNVIRHAILATVLVLGPSAVRPANAAVIIDVTEVGSNVLFAVNGSLNLTGATFVGDIGYLLGFIPGGDNWYVATGLGNTAVKQYALTSFDGAYGTSQTFFTPPMSSFGDNFFIWGHGGVDPRSVGLPLGYISGSPIVSGMTFSGTIAGFTMIPGTYHYNLPNDTITLNIGQATVPEPAMLLLLGGGTLGVVRRFRRQRP